MRVLAHVITALGAALAAAGLVLVIEGQSAALSAAGLALALYGLLVIDDGRR